MEINRRDFMKVCAIAAGQAVITGCAGKNKLMAFNSNKQTGFPRRRLGKTGRDVSIIALGGMTMIPMEPAQAKKLIDDSIEKGINYFDVAPTYGDAELKFGPALKPYRDQIFLACKSTHRDRLGIEKEITNSLKRLETDHLDLYQLHAIADVEKDVHAALGKGGAMEAILEARKKGLIRHIGFTAHSPEAALAAMKEFDFDTMMYPINFCTHFRNRFEVEPLAQAKKRDMGIIAIKALAKQKWPKNANHSEYANCWYEPLTKPEQARLALYWTLSQGVTLAIPPGDEKIYRLAIDFAPHNQPLTHNQEAELKTLAENLDPIFPLKPG
ncbi:MAG: aldo/keto reductase [Phycisphaerae bacterium]